MWETDLSGSDLPLVPVQFLQSSNHEYTQKSPVLRSAELLPPPVYTGSSVKWGSRLARRTYGRRSQDGKVISAEVVDGKAPPDKIRCFQTGRCAELAHLLLLLRETLEAKGDDGSLL